MEQSVPEGVQQVERTHAIAVCELQLTGRAHVGEVNEGR